MQKITYDDFCALYPDRLTDDDFDRLIPSGLAFVNALTANRAAAAEGYKAERVKQAVCAVVKELAAQESCKGENGARIISVSNDGYSENYGNLNDAAAEEAALRSVAFRYLSGTGLVSAL